MKKPFQTNSSDGISCEDLQGGSPKPFTIKNWALNSVSGFIKNRKTQNILSKTEGFWRGKIISIFLKIITM